MNDILNQTNSNSNINNYINNKLYDENIHLNPDYILSQQLSDVMQEPNVPQMNYDNNYDDLTVSLSLDINTEILTAFMDLNPNLLNGFGNNLSGKWAKNEYRGGKIYKPPNGWIGFGLNVLNKYDNGNNDWLACNGRPGEWCVAYHRACRGKSNNEVKRILKLF